MRSTLYTSLPRLNSTLRHRSFISLYGLIALMISSSISVALAETAQPKQQLKATLKRVTVSALKESGKPWDAQIPLRKQSALPDLSVEVKRGAEVLLTTKVQKDTLVAIYENERFFFWSGDVITVNVWDRDVAKHDLIETFELVEERGQLKLRKGSVESLQLSITAQPAEVLVQDSAHVSHPNTQRDPHAEAHAKTSAVHDRIATLDIKQVVVEPTKSNGKAWDVKIPLRPQSMLPDLWVEVRHEGRILLQTPVKKDAVQVEFSDQFVSFPPDARLEIKVWDKDLTRNDLIGTIIITKQSGLVTFSHDRVKVFKVMIVGSVEH